MRFVLEILQKLCCAEFISGTTYIYIYLHILLFVNTEMAQVHDVPSSL